jgi:hypothetical protein
MKSSIINILFVCSLVMSALQCMETPETKKIKGELEQVHEVREQTQVEELERSPKFEKLNKVVPYSIIKNASFDDSNRYEIGDLVIMQNPYKAGPTEYKYVCVTSKSEDPDSYTVVESHEPGCGGPTLHNSLIGKFQNPPLLDLCIEAIIQSVHNDQKCLEDIEKQIPLELYEKIIEYLRHYTIAEIDTYYLDQALKICESRWRNMYNKNVQPLDAFKKGTDALNKGIDSKLYAKVKKAIKILKGTLPQGLYEKVVKYFFEN